jgi:hypothetical protein
LISEQGAARSIAYPGPDKLRALATFFEVHVDYFTQEREEAADARW